MIACPEALDAFDHYCADPGDVLRTVEEDLGADLRRYVAAIKGRASYSYAMDPRMSSLDALRAGGIAATTPSRADRTT